MNPLSVFGLLALGVAGAANYVVPRLLSDAQAVTDPLVGLLYGVGIAATLLGIRRRQEPSSCLPTG
jgi:hypothetical protein